VLHRSLHASPSAIANYDDQLAISILLRKFLCILFNARALPVHHPPQTVDVGVLERVVGLA
jgi:hypothetical protein